MAVQINQNKDVSDFLLMNESLLLREESMNNLILGLSDSMKKGLRVFEEALFFTVIEGNKVLGQAIRSESNRPFVIAKADERALMPLARELSKRNISLAGVVGPRESSTIFSNIWLDINGGTSQITMHQGIYELVEVSEPNYLSGNMVVATKEHLDIVQKFTLGFINECFPEDNDPRNRANEMASRHINNGTIFLWRNSSKDIVSMASKNRESKNAATISLVYTPKKLRSQGYASCIVAKLSKKLLLGGKEKCNLFTDLTNPASNSIYRKIGYKFLGESMHFKFNDI